MFPCSCLVMAYTLFAPLRSDLLLVYGKSGKIRRSIRDHVKKATMDKIKLAPIRCADIATATDVILMVVPMFLRWCDGSRSCIIDKVCDSQVLALDF